MKDEQRQFLNLARFPAVLSREQVSWRLGFELHEIDILIAAKKLKPLAKPARTGKKQFANVTIERLANDENALDALRATIIRFWEAKNASRTGSSLPTSED